MTPLEQIKAIQGILNVTPDGIFGPISRAALEKAVVLAEKPPVTPVSEEIGTEFDARTEKNLATLDPAAQVIFRPFIQAAKEAAEKLGFQYTAISGTRSWAEQDKLYAQGRTLPGPI